MVSPSENWLKNGEKAAAGGEGGGRGQLESVSFSTRGSQNFFKTYVGCSAWLRAIGITIFEAGLRVYVVGASNMAALAEVIRWCLNCFLHWEIYRNIMCPGNCASCDRYADHEQYEPRERTPW